MAACALGLGGYGALIFVAHGSHHADTLRGAAILWLIAFGALNFHFIFERR